MVDGKNGLNSRLEARLGPRQLKQQLDALQKETGGLLDGDALLVLVADEQGLAEKPLSTLAELDPSQPVFTRCFIESVEETREFRGRDRIGRLRKLKVTDATGTMILTLWDEETDLVEQLGLGPGSFIRILSATLRNTPYGQQIHVGKAGFIIPEKAPIEDGPSKPRNIDELGAAQGRADVKGVILALNITGRGRHKMTVIRLFDGTGECELAIPHEQFGLPSGLGQGVELDLLGACVLKKNGIATLLCDNRSRLKII